MLAWPNRYFHSQHSKYKQNCIYFSAEPDARYLILGRLSHQRRIFVCKDLDSTFLTLYYLLHLPSTMCYVEVATVTQLLPRSPSCCHGRQAVATVTQLLRSCHCRQAHVGLLEHATIPSTRILVCEPWLECNMILPTGCQLLEYAVQTPSLPAFNSNFCLIVTKTAARWLKCTN